MNPISVNTSPQKEFEQLHTKQDTFVDFFNATNEMKSPTLSQESPTLNFKRRQSSYRPNLNIYKNISLRNQRASILQICPKTEGNEDEEDEEEAENIIFEVKTNNVKNKIDIQRTRDKNKKLSVMFSQNEENKGNKITHPIQRQFSMNVNSFQRYQHENKNGAFPSSFTKSARKQSESIQSHSAQARENLKRILKKGLLLNNTVKLFTQIIGARYIQRKTESLFGGNKSKIDLQKSKYFDDMLFNKGLFSKEYINPQNEFLKALLSLPIDLQNPIHSDIAINILKKKLKSPLENQYLSRCLLTQELFQQNSNILEDQASLKIIFEEINHVFFPKNSIIFNFGKVYCFIPRPDKKDKLLNEQVEIERQAIKSKHAIPLLSSQLIHSSTQSNCNSPASKRKSSIPCVSQKIIDTPFNLDKVNSPVRKSILSVQADKSGEKSNSVTKTQSRFFQSLKNEDSQEDSMIESDVSVLDHQQQQQQQEEDDKECSESITQIMKQAFKQKKTENYNSKKIIESSESINEDTIFQQTFFPEMNMVKIYSPGEAFGEIALMTKERRTASLVCKEDTHLMVLSKEGFEKILGSYQKSIIRQKVLFLKSFSFLKSIANSQLMSLLHYFDIRSYNQKQIIYQENDPVNQIYFIQSGEVEIQKQIFVESNIQAQVTQEMSSIQETQANLLFNKSIQAKGKQQQKKIISIKIVGPSQYFGQDEILSQEPCRHFRAIALQQAQIYVIQKKDLFTFLKQHKQMDSFKEQNNVKQQWQKAREEEATQLASLRDITSKHLIHSEQSTPNNKSMQPQFNIDPYVEKLKNSKSQKLLPQIIPNAQELQQKARLYSVVQNQLQQNQQSQLLANKSQIIGSDTKNNTKEQQNSGIFIKQNSLTSKKRNLQSIDLRIIKTQEDEEEEEDENKSSRSTLKKKFFQSQQDIIQGKKRIYEKISSTQHSESTINEKPNSHFIELQKLQKINEQNQQIMKEIHKQRKTTASVERQQMDNCTKGYGFDLCIEQMNKQNKKEIKFINSKHKYFYPEITNSTSERSENKNWKSFDRNSESQETSPVLSCSYNNPSSKQKQRQLLQKSCIINSSCPSISKKESPQKQVERKSNSDSKDKFEFSISNYHKESLNKNNPEELFYSNFSQGSYFRVEQLHGMNTKMQNYKHKYPKSLNISNNNSLNEFNTKSLENSPLISYYEKSDDIKEDIQLPKRDEQFSITSLGQHTLAIQQQQSQQQYKKKQNFISQFFQNNEIIKNKSIQKILKHQQKNHYLFKQLYNQTDKKLEDNLN